MNSRRPFKFPKIFLISLILLSLLGTSAMNPMVSSTGPAKVGNSLSISLETSTRSEIAVRQMPVDVPF